MSENNRIREIKIAFYAFLFGLEIAALLGIAYFQGISHPVATPRSLTPTIPAPLKTAIADENDALEQYKFSVNTLGTVVSREATAVFEGSPNMTVLVNIVQTEQARAAEARQTFVAAQKTADYLDSQSVRQTPTPPIY